MLGRHMKLMLITTILTWFGTLSKRGVAAVYSEAMGSRTFTLAKGGNSCGTDSFTYGGSWI